MVLPIKSGLLRFLIRKRVVVRHSLCGCIGDEPQSPGSLLLGYVGFSGATESSGERYFRDSLESVLLQKLDSHGTDKSI